MNKLLKLFNILREPLFVQALLQGTAAGTEHGRLLQSLDCRHVVDVGANCGQFALIRAGAFRMPGLIPLSLWLNRRIGLRRCLPGIPISICTGVLSGLRRLP